MTPPDEKYNWATIPADGPPKRKASDRSADFNEIYGEFDAEAVQAQASRCIQCPDALCVQGCGLQNRIPEWMALTAEGRFLEAAEISRATSNLPEICSRICPQEKLCEGACILGAKGEEAVAIGAIERFINDYALDHGAVDAVQVPPNGRKVAIIGSGPSGLSCADELIQRGYAVTILESSLIPGGLLVNGIPAFKLEKHLVERRVALLAKRGVQFKLGIKVGWDITLAKLREDYDAVFLAFGAQHSKTLDIPGGNLPGVVEALPFLIQKNVESPLLELPDVPVTGLQVAVLGGGDTAMDCLRTALRCGASDTVCLYRRDLANMPGSQKEYANALEEGARFEFLTNPVEVLADADGRVKGVRCEHMVLGEPDASGRSRPQAIPGSEHLVPADLILVAYGFDFVPFPDHSDFSALALEKWGTIKCDANQMTNLAGVFSGGDSVRGPSLVVHAVRDGRRAAQGIDRYLQTVGV